MEAIEKCLNPECGGKCNAESNPPYHWVRCEACGCESPGSEGTPYNAVRLHNIIAVAAARGALTLNPRRRKKGRSLAPIKPCPNPECGRKCETEGDSTYWVSCMGGHGGCGYEGPKVDGDVYEAVRLHNLVVLAVRAGLQRAKRPPSDLQRLRNIFQLADDQGLSDEEFRKRVKSLVISDRE